MAKCPLFFTLPPYFYYLKTYTNPFCFMEMLGILGKRKLPGFWPGSS